MRGARNPADAAATVRARMSASGDVRAIGSAAPRRKPLLRHPFRRKNFRPRALVLYAGGLGAIAAADPAPVLFALGAVVVATGQALRLWATGYLVKTDELTTAGPYAHMRHPLYAGALLMGTGFLLMAGPRIATVALPLGLVFYFGYYLGYKDAVESERLEALYGATFRAWRDGVPPLWPRWSRWRSPLAGGPARWRIERVLENDEQTALAYAVIAAIALMLVGLWRGF